MDGDIMAKRVQTLSGMGEGIIFILDVVFWNLSYILLRFPLIHVFVLVYAIQFYWQRKIASSMCAFLFKQSPSR